MVRINASLSLTLVACARVPLEDACREFCDRVNARVHRETAAAPQGRLAAEREMLHPLPDEPHALALGEERLVSDDQTIRFGSVRYSTPPGHAGTRVWCRVAGEELVIAARTGRGAAEIARHRLSVPGSPSICDEHYPHHPGGNGPRQPRPRPRTQAEAEFLAIGDGPDLLLVPADKPGTPTKLDREKGEDLYDGQLSPPDGRWIAYTSDSASVKARVSVRPMGPGNAKWVVTPDGGWQASWRADGSRLPNGGTVRNAAANTSGRPSQSSTCSGRKATSSGRSLEGAKVSRSRRAW